jgi:hypothetical protein
LRDRSTSPVPAIAAWLSDFQGRFFPLKMLCHCTTIRKGFKFLSHDQVLHSQPWPNC